MQPVSKAELKNLIDKSSEELHRRIDSHYSRITSILESTSGDRSEMQLMKMPAFERENRFKAAFMETIEVLEETRRAFKSKRLEALRWKLTHVLIDTE